MRSGIYKITNKLNNKSYIGLSKNVESRLNEHSRNFGYKSYSATKQLYFAFQEYGKDNFSFEILERCPEEKLGERENYYIKKYNSFKNGYNQSWGGEGSSSETMLNKFNIDLEIFVFDRQKYENKDWIVRELKSYTQKIDKMSKKNLNLFIIGWFRKRSLLRWKSKAHDLKQRIIQIERNTEIRKERYQSVSSAFEEHKKFDYYCDDSFYVGVVQFLSKRFQKNNTKYVNTWFEEMEGDLIIQRNKLYTKIESKKSNSLRYEDFRRVYIKIYDRKIKFEFNLPQNFESNNTKQYYADDWNMVEKNFVAFYAYSDSEAIKIFDSIRYQIKI